MMVQGPPAPREATGPQASSSLPSPPRGGAHLLWATEPGTPPSILICVACLSSAGSTCATCSGSQWPPVWKDCQSLLYTFSSISVHPRASWGWWGNTSPSSCAHPPTPCCLVPGAHLLWVQLPNLLKVDDQILLYSPRRLFWKRKVGSCLTSRFGCLEALASPSD